VQDSTVVQGTRMVYECWVTVVVQAYNGYRSTTGVQGKFRGTGVQEY